MSFISGIRLQAFEDAQENSSWYGEPASEPIFYAYVGNDPLNLTDPSGLIGLGASAGGITAINRHGR
jgi:hypothetical protein